MIQGLYNRTKGIRFLDGHIYSKQRTGGNIGPRSFNDLITWMVSSTSVITDAAAQFSAVSSSQLSSSSSELATTGNWTWTGWFYFSGTGTQTLMSKYNSTGNQRGWVLRVNLDTGVMNIIISNDGSSIVYNQDWAEVASGFWYFVSITYDFALSKNLFARVNDSQELFLDVTTIFNGTAAFKIGVFDTVSFPFDGKADSVARWNRVLTASEITYLYNNGAGKIYADLNSSIKTSLVSWWDLDEDTGTRFDAHGSNNLTDSSVTRGAGIAAGTATDGDPVSLWLDNNSSLHNQLPTSFAARPLFKTGTLITYPSLLFDGVDDYLAATGFALNQPYTLYLVLKQQSWSNGTHLTDGRSNISGAILQSGTTPGLALASPTTGVVTSNLPLLSGGIVTAVFSGTSSSIQINNRADITGNAGGNALGGLTLGSRADGTKNSNVHFYEAILYSGAHNGASRASVKAYLANKYALTI